MGIKFDIWGRKFEVDLCDSAKAVQSRLEGLDCGVFLNAGEYADKFAVVRVSVDEGETRSSVGIGIGWYFPGNPSILQGPRKDEVWIAYDECVHLINIREPKCLFELSLELRLPYYDLVRIDDESIAVVYELGVVALDSKCEVLWEIDGMDVLTDYHVKDGEIVCTFMEGGVMRRKLKED